MGEHVVVDAVAQLAWEFEKGAVGLLNYWVSLQVEHDG